MGGTIHWEFARRILDALPPAPRDGDVRQWYRATAAWLQERNEYAEFQPHVARARYLFPVRPGVHDVPRHHAHGVRRAADPERAAGAQSDHDARPSRELASTGPPAPIGAAEVELDRAEGWFRKALAQDRDFTEARIRLGYVLSRLGRHADADRGAPARPRLKTRRACCGTTPSCCSVARSSRAGVPIWPSRPSSGRRTLYPNAQSPRLALEPTGARRGRSRDRSVRELTRADVAPRDRCRSRRSLVGLQLDARAKRGRATRAAPPAMGPMTRLLLGVCLVLALGRPARRLSRRCSRPE